MKKSKFAGILKARAAEPESEPTPAPVKRAPAPKISAEKRKRFHTTLYLDKEFYNKIKIALIQEGQDRDFNRLVNDLLKEWHSVHGDD